MERNYILFDTPERELLYPFTHTRPVAACRTGILTIAEKWEHWLGNRVSHMTIPSLQSLYPLHQGQENTLHLLINGHILPDEALVAAIRDLQPDEELYSNNHLIVKALQGREVHLLPARNRKNYHGKVLGIYRPWDIFVLNDQALRADFALLTQGRSSAPIPPGNQVIHPEGVFIEPGATVSCSVINASTGPVYIGKDAQVLEGCMIRGPFAMGEGAVLKMGTRIYGATTLGPGCIGSGEIKNSVMFGYSNKAHEGYLGDAVIGEWCNLGAHTTCSNLKNNGSMVKVWMEARGTTMEAGQKCGLLMGDYSRCGINTMLNTGTVIGVSCNIFGGNFPPKFLPSFSWGQEDGSGQYRLPEALRDAAVWKSFKGQTLTEAEQQLLTAVYEASRVNNNKIFQSI